VTIPAGVAHLPAVRGGDARVLAPTRSEANAYAEEALGWLPNSDTTSEPALEFHDQGLVSAASRAASGTATTPGKPLARIIWADDNADMREYVRRLLAATYDVVAVADGLAALTAAQSAPPDLVLSDIMMPGLDGLGLLRELRADARTRTVPIILLSARAGQESTVQGLEAGADDYLTKPFSAAELLARVRTHLELANMRRKWVEELERANHELEAFSYSVSHDLRAPLRAIDGFSKAVLDEYGEKLDENARLCLQKVRTGAAKMSLLINDLLDLSRVGRYVVRIEPVNLTGLAREAESGLRQREPERSIAVEIEDGLSAHGDVRLLTMVLVNLLENAWKYTAKQPKPKIVVGHEQQGDEAVFFVRDNGVGFDMAYIDKLFLTVPPASPGL